MRTEKDLQAYLKKRCKKAGILCYKFASPAHRGVPDLILIARFGTVVFVELKSPSGRGRLSELQTRTIGRLIAQNAIVCVIDSVMGVDELITDLEMEPTDVYTH